MSHPPSVRYAGLGSRLLAMLLDGVLLAFLFALLRFVPVMWNPAAYLVPDTVSALNTRIISPQELIGMFLAAMFITALLWNRFAGTPGKLLMGLRVVCLKSGNAPRLGQALLRFIGYLLSLLPASLGFLWTLWDKRRQGFHDKLSCTAVIIDDESVKSLQQLMDEAR